MAVANDYDIANQALAIFGQPEITSLTAGGRDADVCNLFYTQNRDTVLGLRGWRGVLKRASLGDDTSEATITGISQTDPGVVTAVAHGFQNGDQVVITAVVGMTQVNNEYFTVAGVTADTFELESVDTTGYTAYSSGGTADRNQTAYAYMYDKPADCLRVIDVMDEAWGADDYDWIMEGPYLFTDVETARVRYVKQETDVTRYSAELVEVMVARLAVQIALVVTGDDQRRMVLHQQYLAVLAQSTATDTAGSERATPPDAYHTTLR